MIDAWTALPGGWGTLLLAAILLFVLYMLLHFSQKMLANDYWQEDWQIQLSTFLRWMITLFEPFALLLLSALFVVINPKVDGLVLLIIVLGTFSQLRNYFSGQILQLGQTVKLGTQIKFKNIEGIVADLGRIGIQIRTEEGLHFVNHSSLLKDGYLIVSGDTIGNLYRLNIHPKEAQEKQEYYHLLKDLVVSSPYLDKSYTPELTADKNRNHHFTLQLMLKEEQHLNNLLDALSEWGFVGEEANG